MDFSTFDHHLAMQRHILAIARQFLMRGNRLSERAARAGYYRAVGRMFEETNHV